MNTITKKVDVEIKLEKAFKKFVTELNGWWPKEYTWAQDELQKIYIEEKENGLCTEIGPYGFRCDWGRVTKLIVDKHISIIWQISPHREPIPNPENASNVDIRFTEKADHGTFVTLTHYNFDNHGEEGASYRKALDSQQGWDYILHCYKAYCEEQ